MVADCTAPAAGICGKSSRSAEMFVLARGRLTASMAAEGYGTSVYSSRPESHPTDIRALLQLCRGIIFDMDGVLVLSTPVHEAAFREVFAPFNIDFSYQDYAGMRTRDTIDAIVEANGLDLSTEMRERLARSKTAAAVKRLQTSPPLADYAREVLHFLHTRYVLGLATSASASSVEAVVHATGLNAYFQRILCADDISKAKPAPEIYLRASGLMGLQPRECLVIEDSAAGIAAARAAGAYCAALAGTLSRPQLLCAGADVVLDDLRELMQP